MPRRLDARSPDFGAAFDALVAAKRAAEENVDAVVAAIRVGFRRLSPAARQVLAAASILDPRVDPALLARGTGLSPGETITALDELEWHRWMVSEPRGYSFVARVVRQVVARDMLTPGQRRRILERLGRSD